MSLAVDTYIVEMLLIGRGKMKKTTSTILAVVILLTCSSIINAGKESKFTTFKGRVIFLSDDYIEVKRGRIEVLLYYSDKTKFVKLDGTENGKNIIKICQYVRARYTKDKKNKLDEIVILKESDCIK